MMAASQPWAPHLQVRVAIDDVPQGKPEPDVYLLAAVQLGVRAALNAGATCLFVTNGAVASERARELTPHVVASLPAWRDPR